MSVRAKLGRQELCFLAFLSIGALFITYSFTTAFINHQTVSPPRKLASEEWEGRLLVDPVTKMPERTKKLGQERSPFHVAVTATDSPYSRWQCRIMYYWYKKKMDLPGSEMGKFTRILHTGLPDNLMDEIPTFVVDPLPDGVDKGYVVLHRPWAFVQWLEKAKIEEEYILMAEPDHIFLKPLPNLSYKDYPVAFPFFYIKPKKHERLLRKYYPEEMGPITNIDPIGNSPVIIKKELLAEIAPTWMNISLKIKHDPETDKALGWVQEMYAYAVASALHNVRHILRKDFMLQPPWDIRTTNAYILHFTYGCDYTMKGKLIYGQRGEWRFDKRDFLDFPPPRNLSLPPPEVPQSVASLIKLINEASSNLPNWDTIGEVEVGGGSGGGATTNS
ncbi:hydroxyproline O-arabinosyltransferase RDN2-like isoform X2 [Andrographis paniculata]|nr:hydroxyproline O-arabinosyltransferase RDN2-like isoform X2 [Andrographis paniculata]XP_051123473.1 hydroxyproline O-arabinosyltransferase RDN2-like isoform X2 [Andrographis paniculata]